MVQVGKGARRRDAFRCDTSLIWGVFIGALVTALLFTQLPFKPDSMYQIPYKYSESATVQDSTPTMLGSTAGSISVNVGATKSRSGVDVPKDTEEANLAWHEKSRPILTDFPPIGRRLEFLHHLEKLPSFQTAIEVGVQKGILAKKSLDIWQSCTEYLLVDLWGKEEGYNEPGPDTVADKDANLKQARRRMKQWVGMGKVKFFVMRSTDAAKELPDNHFDYIYLDARHDYCAVKEDIQHYWPKLRPGGILGGHDYIDAQYAIDRLGPAENWGKCEDGSTHPEAVKGAVDEFRKREGDLSVYTSNEDFPSWYVQKPYE